MAKAEKVDISHLLPTERERMIRLVDELIVRCDDEKKRLQGERARLLAEYGSTPGRKITNTIFDPRKGKVVAMKGGRQCQ